MTHTVMGQRRKNGELGSWQSILNKYTDPTSKNIIARTRLLYGVAIARLIALWIGAAAILAIIPFAIHVASKTQQKRAAAEAKAQQERMAATAKAQQERMAATAKAQQELEILKHKADQNDKEAQWLLGNYLDNHGDRHGAKNMWRKAGKQGHLLSQLKMASVLVDRLDDSEKSTWYEMAANQGNCYAQMQLGDMNLKNIEDIIDTNITISKYAGSSAEPKEWQIKLMDEYRESAIYWYEMAASKGDSEAQYKLGNLYLNMSRQSWDQYEEQILLKDKAVEWFRASAKQGHIESRKTLDALGIIW